MNQLKNSVRLTGYLGKAPEIKITGNQKKLARLSLAINENYLNEKGESVQDTQWHQLVLWEKQAEVAEKYLAKGSGIAVLGRLVNRSFTDKEGNRRYATEVVVSELLLLDKKQD